MVRFVQKQIGEIVSTPLDQEGMHIRRVIKAQSPHIFIFLLLYNSVNKCEKCFHHNHMNKCESYCNVSEYCVEELCYSVQYLSHNTEYTHLS